MSTDKIKPVHPCEVLLEEFLKPMKLSHLIFGQKIGQSGKEMGTSNHKSTKNK
jgi:plasmid maintenance system antidote protein VapI